VSAGATPIRRAVVTGGASGIGRATVRRLLRDGVEVIAVDRAGEALEALADEGAAIVTADLAREDDRARVCEAGAGADYLVNSAGIMRVSPILEVTAAEWRDVLAVNAEAVFFLCQGLGARLRPGGAIVNLSSAAGKLANNTDVACYAASKAAVLSITRSFAHALADAPIRVNAVCPGLVSTPMQSQVLEEVAALRNTTVEALSSSRTANVPLGRECTPEECAGVICFLLSDDAAYMTGQAVNVTGGLVTW
jgi:NAD(P)-dependent dehydrogenase (short-subunit alcohol dehydrogenase family)